MFDKYLLISEEDTKKLGSKIADNIKKNDIITLSGDLGSGKTFLCREIIKNLCGKQTKVISPTFNLLQTYDYRDFLIYHFDLYRLNHFSEVYELGIEEAFTENICLIEWPEVISNVLPANTITIDIKINSKLQREVVINQISRAIKLSVLKS